MSKRKSETADFIISNLLVFNFMPEVIARNISDVMGIAEKFIWRPAMLELKCQLNAQQ
jgi:hypothetical protein